MRSLVLCVALVGAAAVAQQPTKLWETDIPETHDLEMRGGDVLITAQGERIVFDAATGRRLGSLKGEIMQARLSAGRLLVSRGEYYRPGALEAWKLRPFELEARMPSSVRIGLGEIVGNNIFYGTDTSVVRASYPGFETKDIRRLDPYSGPLRPKVADGTVYFNYAGHETYALHANDLSRGWRAYCDAWPQHVDEHGFVGTATVMWGMKIVDRAGKERTLERVADGWYTFLRQRPLVTKDFVVLGGSVSKSGYVDNQYAATVLSSYLLAFDRKTGSLVWKVPMVAALGWYSTGLTPVLLNDNRVFLYGANSKGGELVWTQQVRDLATGKLLWRSKPVAEKQRWMLASNGTIAVEVADRKLRAWRIASR